MTPINGSLPTIKIPEIIRNTATLRSRDIQLFSLKANQERIWFLDVERRDSTLEKSYPAHSKQNMHVFFCDVKERKGISLQSSSLIRNKEVQGRQDKLGKQMVSRKHNTVRVQLKMRDHSCCI